MHLRMQADKAHQERRPGAGMTKDEELLAREELFDLRHFLERDVGNGIAFFPSGIPFEQDADSGTKAGKH
jgi:hypothetical protein